MEASRLTLRFITSGHEMMLVRMWPFQDLMAARPDVDYSVHLLGEYTGEPELVRTRPYVHQRLPDGKGANEVWLFRGWNRAWLVAAPYLARLRRIPLMLWHETPGRTYEATSSREALRIRLREFVLPQLFRPYRGCVMLGIGELATRRFAELAPGSTAHLLPYPDDRADALLGRPPREVAAGRVSRLLFVGELSRRKGVDVLVAACEQLWRDGHEFSVTYAGAGPMDDLMRGHAARSNGRVKLLGHVRGSALLDLYEEVDGLVIPSRWDAWGLVIHEALAAGLPVIASDACGARILGEGCTRIVKAGDKDSLADGLRWWLSLPAEIRRGIAYRGRAAAVELTMDRIGDALVGHAREALARARRVA